jgi:ATP-dependent helicase YprA (DUF1998 family)
MLPSLVADDLRRTLGDYLGTTFALTDDDARAALEGFLLDPDTGIFRGPFVRLRLPFRPADDDWRATLDWSPSGFTPYRHQAQAFARLDSRRRRPQPTIVTTGTGSGKTEAFLVPVLDHCRREVAAGRTGVKALLLYPMNALANDQARRIAELVHTEPALAGVTVGLYTGDQGNHTFMGPDHVIDDRHTIQTVPPDILITNYKMLDFLLLRREDADLWRHSRDSLTYLVLDEFHTYDGAQGTDVAMLLRRLGATLGVAKPGRPLGEITPVATSATLGEGTTGREALLDFAAEVFGERPDDGAVIGEDRLTTAEWLDPDNGNGSGSGSGGKNTGSGSGAGPPLLSVAQVALDLAKDRSGRLSHDHVADLVAALVVDQAEQALAGAALPRHDNDDLVDLVHAHPLTAALLRHATGPIALDDLIAAAVPQWSLTSPRDLGTARTVMSGYLALISRARLPGDPTRPLLQLDVQVWVREVRRLLRRVAPAASMRWHTDVTIDRSDLHLPAVYCRHCGRSGWGAGRPPAGRTLVTDAASVWADAVQNRGSLVALIHAAGEAAAGAGAEPGVERGEQSGAADEPVVQWFVPRTGELVAVEPVDDDTAVPVLPPVELDEARRERCPACRQDDGIRFLGSRVATLVSVLLGHLFGSSDVLDAEKKTLLFTDSVQDAAHHAAFVEARGYALNLRAVTTAVIGARDRNLGEVGAAIVDHAMAGTRDQRYALLPPDLQQHRQFQRFWQERTLDVATRDRVARRLQLSATLEFGLGARTGRTLELTGTVATTVNLGSERSLLRDLDRALRELPSRQGDLLTAAVDPRDLRAWMWGVLQRLRLRGGIANDYFNTYLDEDGNRWSIWGGRDRTQGWPAFPGGRPAPFYPVTAARARDGFDTITAVRGWYARWTARLLAVPPTDAPTLIRCLLDVLTRRGVLQQRTTASGATAWLLPVDRLLLASVRDEQLAAAEAALRCQACAERLPCTGPLREAMDGQPCLRDRCPGRYAAEGVERDYYRDLYRGGAVRRIVAREHTGLLDGPRRAALETSFKQGGSPDAPNVLACTPTLELGIDIGDLSIVTLTSLPRSTAAYLQRVGRAGRRTGNALVVAVLPSRPLELQRLADPLSMIAGEVVPPACHLDATEILQRQYLAFVVDRAARAGVEPPRNARAVLGAGTGPGSWLGRLLADARRDAAVLTAQFIDLFGERITADTRAAMRTYTGLDGPAAVPPFEQTVADACRRWTDDMDERWRRLLALRAERARLDALGESLDEESERDRRRVNGELGAAIKARNALQREYWITALEGVGLLPNYALLDDRTTLDVTLWWTDEESGRSQTAEDRYVRGSRTALAELAPGAVFYVRGSAVHIDGVDLGTSGNPSTQVWRCCPSCGWAGEDAGAIACPRCGDARAADTGQRLLTAPFRGASAYEPRDGAATGDDRDDRERTRFTIAVGVDVPPGSVAQAWRLRDYPFGVEYSRSADLRWINLGPEAAGGRPRELFGGQLAAPLFHTCRHCGVVPAAQRTPLGGRHTPQSARHRGWCPQRQQFDPDGWVDVALTHHLRTQALRLLVPPVVLADDTLLVSLRAALLLGLRDLLGGEPDHLDVIVAVTGPPSRRQNTLVLHDKVPGGTCYLAQIAAPDQLHRLLGVTLARLESCPCATEAVAACHRCLLAHTPPAQADLARRDRAVEVIRTLLEHWDCEWVASLGDIEGGSLESPLEQRFRQALRRWVASTGGTLTESAEPLGDRWDLRLPGPDGNDVAWTMRPQVALDGCRPDFVLTSPRSRTPIAVFTDGAEFHSSVRHNRLADDAEKRSALRDDGYLVWAVTSEDVDAFMAAEPEWDRTTTARPLEPGSMRWADAAQCLAYDQIARQLVTQANSGGGSAGGGSAVGGMVPPAALMGDAVTLLVRLLQRPDLSAWGPAGRAVALSLVPRTGFDTHTTPESAVRVAAGLLTGQAAPADGAGSPASVRLTAHGAAVAVLKRAGRVMAADAVVVVDDRDATTGSAVQLGAWRDWLALSTVLQLADQDCRLTTLTLSTAAQAGAGAPSATAASADPVPASSAVDGELDQQPSPVEAHLRHLLDLAAASTHPLLRHLTDDAARTAQVGYENDDGIPIEVCWPVRRVAIVVGDDSELDAWLDTQGWQRIAVDDIDAADRLRAAGLTTTSGVAP